MKRPVQVVLLLLIGAGLLHSALFTDLYLRYVKEGLRPLLIASGVLLTLLGAVSGVLGWRERKRERAGGGAADCSADGHACTRDHEHQHQHQHAHDHGDEHQREHTHDHDHGDEHQREHTHDHGHDHGHDHAAAPRVAWLLFLPALSLLVYAPSALGAYTAARAGGKPVARHQQFAPLPATSPLPMTLTDFTTRVQQDHAHAIEGRAVRLTGFVTPAARGGGWYLTRIIFTCCAADAQTVKIRMYGGGAPAADTWLAVTGTWHPRGALGTRSAEAALDVRGTRPMAQPVNAFTDDLPLTPS
ncbi:TIGR03943 family putative permease subunit [Streptomyces mangrovisoli]|uniref:TIGR03943 family protein n=1 Tax=Streptomyces mangrovisoli TaxID=1428628 RepID=A0A1J4P640_9ACTN|nr:TIGR03943 family protein [Streptomyces mangrovisoli]OIJ68973.1 TIGR03943 family protein [Streptomyces mangrovisoli]